MEKMWVAAVDTRMRFNFPGKDEETIASAAAEESKPLVIPSFKQKIIEILKNLHCAEVKIYSEASKEFIRLLNGDSGAEILREYVQSSPKCVELAEAWNLHQKNPGMAHILSLVSAILDHPKGKSWISGISKSLDAFARSIYGTKLDDIYDELKSDEWRRQSATLFLLASIVRRGVSLASLVAESFDFKLPVLTKLSGVQKKKRKESRHQMRRSTRQAFVEFALSFLEVGKSRLLKWVLQKREVYSGVLRGIRNDDVETIVYILSTLRDKVLTRDSPITTPLRSVLFGSATLEQLSDISGNSEAGPAAEIAQDVLVRVCTDYRNGLMPGPNLKGNEKRLFDLMKKLKATEIRYHRDLLLAIVKMSPSLCSAYMDEFPYHLEPRSSSLWFDAISLAADMISSVNAGTAFESINSPYHGPLDVSNKELQNILKCIIPRTFTRSVINKGLLHSDVLVKHGSLRILLESVKSLGKLINAIENIIEKTSAKEMEHASWDAIAKLHGVPGFSCFVDVDRCLDAHGIDTPTTDKIEIQKWVSLKQYIQDEVRAVLPDPQVLLKLLSSLRDKNPKNLGASLKRRAYMPEVGSKRLKSDITSANIDIFISGIDATPEDRRTGGAFTDQELDVDKDHTKTIADIWGLNEQITIHSESKVTEKFFHSKLLDVLTLYLRTMAITFEGSFDFFKVLPVNPQSLSIDQQRSLLSLLVEYIGQPIGSRVSANALESMYKHLHSLIDFLIYSQDKDIQDQAYSLARAAMISTGAFDQNLSEIDAWFFSLPGYNIKRYTSETQGPEAFHGSSSVVVSFLCDAVSTVGNNLYKYLDHTRKFICELDDTNDDSPDFSPLIICILQKCLRLLESDSGTFKVYERSMISLYVCNAISMVLQTQVEMRVLPALIQLVLTEKVEDNFSIGRDSRGSPCEWRPMMNLLLLARKILEKQIFSHSISGIANTGKNSSLFLVLSKVKDFLEHGHGGSLVGLSFALSSSIICAPTDDILMNFPFLLIVAERHFRSHLPLLLLVLSLEHEFLANVAYMWPDMFFSGLEMLEGMTSYGCNKHFLTNSEAVCSTGTSMSTDYSNSMESSAAAFSLYLKHAPFYAFFSAILTFGSCELDTTRVIRIMRSAKMLDLIRDKLCEGSVDNIISSLRYVLFWTYQILLSYRANPSDVLKELFHLCFTLLEYIIQHLRVETTDVAGIKAMGTSSDTNYVHAVIDIIVHHPLVTMFLSHPACCSKKRAKSSFGGCLGDFLISAKQNFNSMDYHILQFLRKAFDFLLAMRKGSEPISMAARRLVQKVSLLLRENFDLCVVKRDMGPVLHSFYIFHSLMHFVSPFELLETVLWMFTKLEDNLQGCTTTVFPAFSVVLYIAEGAFGMLFRRLQQQTARSESNCFWDREVRSFEVGIFQKIYCKILDISMRFHLECADLCLLKIVTAVFSQRFTKPTPSFLPLYMLFSRIVTNSPMKMLIHCLYPTSKIKAKTLLLLIEVSPLHMRLFGHTFLGILNKKLSLMGISSVWQLKDEMSDAPCNYDLSEDQFLLLLPAALSYLQSNLNKSSKEDLTCFGAISVFYSGILLDGFSDWKSFVSRIIFQEEYPESEPTSLEDYHDLFSSSLLGKSVTMFRYCSILGGSSMRKKQRLKVFCTIYPESSVFDELLDCDITQFVSSSCKESLKLINKVVAKISFTRLLLCHPDSQTQFLATELKGESKDMSKESDSKRLNRMKLRFMNILVNTLDLVVRQYPLKTNCSVTSCTVDNMHLRYLEYYLLKNIIQLSMETQSYLIELSTIPFLNLFIKSSLLHRFEDPVTLKAIRCILVALSEGNFSSDEVLELLVGHSQFVSSILSVDTISSPFTSIPSGALLQPIPSILKSLYIPTSCKDAPEGRGDFDPSVELRCNQCASGRRKLELIKLLRILYYVRSRRKNIGAVNFDVMNLRELLSLLLSGYGATLSETDVQIFCLMQEIGSIEGSELRSIAEMDYLWGSSALKIRKEQTLDRAVTPESIVDQEKFDERRILFRENIPVDSKVCVMTILHFCYDRSSRTAPSLLERLLKDDFMDNEKPEPFSNDRMVYDPAFILRFSIHILLMGYIEPVEFSRLGLLAVTFVSISSTDEELRKLGYESLGKFKKALENCRSNKDVLQLQLLLTYLQNGITEPWQKIATVITIFAAEASFLLLDPLQDHFFTISKLTISSSKVNLEDIPLFDTLFGSGSMHLKADRLWILRLLYAGLNITEDADICLRKEIFERILCFYASSLSDPESMILILQIVKKSVRLPKAAECLVQQCGLISWLSSVLSFYGERLGGDQKDLSLKVIESALEVISDLLSLKEINEWLQEFALEQLSEFSTHLHKLFVGPLKLMEMGSLEKPFLHVMVSTLEKSQRRKYYQPHFFISLQGLLQLCEGLNRESSKMGFSVTVENVIIMSIPPPVVSHMDRARLSKLLLCSISSDALSCSNQRSLSKKTDPELPMPFRVHGKCESLGSKLLRWATASVILGFVSDRAKVNMSFSLRSSKTKTLQSLLVGLVNEGSESSKDNSVGDEALAVTLLYLQQLLGKDCNNLSSVIAALCLLLHSDASNATGKEFLKKKRGSILLLCSKIRCPPEVYPAWRWSFEEPWKNQSSDISETEKMEEEQACQNLLLIFSKVVAGEGSLDLPSLSHQDLVMLFDWEMDTISGSRTCTETIGEMAVD